MSKLFYIVGASGAGKDTLMNYCRDQVNGILPIVFAHRYITRPANAGGENHISLSEKEFELRSQHNLFALQWKSHGYYYGIGTEINIWLQNGFIVVINGSREYLHIATQKYPNMHTILIEASPEVIEARLHNRGRETTNNIVKRMARNEQFGSMDKNIISIRNDSSIEFAGNNLLTALLQFEDIDTTTLCENAI